MNKDQARALLALIADLYLLCQVPDPEPTLVTTEPQFADDNGQGVKEPADATR
jgi:hypothetical protein